MISRTHLILALSFLSIQFFVQNQTEPPMPFGVEYQKQRYHSKPTCVQEAQYKSIEEDVNKNCKELNIETNLKKGAMITSFAWPLKASSAFDDCSYYVISNYLDQDVTTAIND